MIDKRLKGIVAETMRYVGLHAFMDWVCLLCNIVFIIGMGIFINNLHLERIGLADILGFAGGISLLVAIRFLCIQKSSHFAFMAAAETQKELRSLVYAKVLHLGLSYTEKISTAEVIQIAVEGIEQLEVYFGRYLPQLYHSVLAPLTLFLLIVGISLKIAMVMLACVLLIPVSLLMVQRLANSLFETYWGTYTDLGETFLENLQGLTTLKIYQADDYKSQEMNRQAESFRRITMQVLMMQLRSITVMDIMAFGGTAAGILLAINEYMHGNITFLSAFIVVFLAAEFFAPLRMLGSYFHAAMNGMTAAQKIFNLLDLEETVDKRQVFANCHIQFRDASFTYDKQRPILQNISMEIGERGLVSLVGESGSGKSTVAALIAGKRGYTGSIKIGGQEVADIDKSYLRKKITVVSHDNYIFQGSIEDNLKMGNPEADLLEMITALKKVRLYDFVFSQQGLSTCLQENGSNLSGGQRQRLALARALLHDSPIYILDEATSNIDAESEADIMTVVREMSGEKLIIMISHRLANVINSDWIYVLDKGRIVESGTHPELMSHAGRYARLYNCQAEIEAYGKGGADLCEQVL